MGIFDYFKKKPDESTPTGEGVPKSAGGSSGPHSTGPHSTGPHSTRPGKPAAEEPQGFFAQFRTALKKTHDVLNTDIRDLFKREGRLVDDEFLTDLYAALIKTDMGVASATRLRDRVKVDFAAAWCT
jgi:fused signal recognition particle receptor